MSDVVKTTDGGTAPAGDRAVDVEATAGTPGATPRAPRRRRGWTSIRSWADVLFVPIVLVVLVLYVRNKSPYFATTSNFKTLLLQAAVLGILALGATFTIIAGELDLSAASNAALSGMVAALAMTDWTDSVVVGVAAGLLCGIVFGAVNGCIVTVARVPSFVATLGTLVIGGGIALSLTDAKAVTGLPDSFGDLSNTLFGGYRLLVWWFLALYVVGYIVLHHTTFGLRLFAVGGNREASRLSGLNVSLLRFSVFVVAGFLAGVAGVLLTARVQTGQPSLPTTYTLYAVAAVVLGGTSLQGGRGGVARTFLGIALIATLQNGLDLLNYSFADQQIAVGGVFILAASSEVLRRRA